METAGTHTFSITTGASTRSESRQTRTWTITAETLDDACYEARKLHIALVGWNASIWISSATELAWTPVA